MKKRVFAFILSLTLILCSCGTDVIIDDIDDIDDVTPTPTVHTAAETPPTVDIVDELPTDDTKEELVVYFASFDLYDFYKKFSGSFQILYPNIEIIPVLHPSVNAELDENAVSEANETLYEELLSGNGPDVIFGAENCFDDIAGAANAGMFADLSPFVDEDPAFVSEQYLENFFDVGLIGGKRLMAPASFILDIPVLHTPRYGGQADQPDEVLLSDMGNNPENTFVWIDDYDYSRLFLGSGMPLYDAMERMSLADNGELEQLCRDIKALRNTDKKTVAGTTDNGSITVTYDHTDKYFYTYFLDENFDVIFDSIMNNTSFSIFYAETEYLTYLPPLYLRYNVLKDIPNLSSVQTQYLTFNENNTRHYGSPADIMVINANSDKVHLGAGLITFMLSQFSQERLAFGAQSGSMGASSETLYPYTSQIGKYPINRRILESYFELNSRVQDVKLCYRALYPFVDGPRRDEFASRSVESYKRFIFTASCFLPVKKLDELISAEFDKFLDWTCTEEQFISNIDSLIIEQLAA